MRRSGRYSGSPISRARVQPSRRGDGHATLNWDANFIYTWEFSAPSLSRSLCKVKRSTSKTNGRAFKIAAPPTHTHTASLNMSVHPPVCHPCLYWVVQATWHYMTQALSSINCCDVTYPSTQLSLAKDRAQLLYFLSGWLLSSALTRVNREHTLRPIFCLFVNRHKY